MHRCVTPELIYDLLLLSRSSLDDNSPLLHEIDKALFLILIERENERAVNALVIPLCCTTHVWPTQICADPASLVETMTDKIHIYTDLV